MQINWTVGRGPLEPIDFDWIWIGLRCPYSYEGKQWRWTANTNTRSGSDFGSVRGCGWGDKETVDTPQSVIPATFGGFENPL